MEAVKFVESLRKSIIEDNLNYYVNTFKDSKTEEVKDPCWTKAITLFQSLNDEKKEVFFSIIRQVQSDTVSNVLGILDGSTYLNDGGTTFELIADEDKINGDLQDLFLELEE